MRRWLSEAVGRDEITLGLGLVLVTTALWPAFGVGALVVPGAVLTWLALPARRSFIERPPRPETPRRAR